MQDINLKESMEHGDISFPFAFYHVDSKHPRYEMQAHWHEESEICRVLEGELRITIDGETYIGRGHEGVGDIFFINSGSLHSAEPQKCVYECVVFDMHFLLRERSLSNSFLYSLLYNQRRLIAHIPVSCTAAYHTQDFIALVTKGERGSAHPDNEVQAMISNIIFNMFTVLREKKPGHKLKTFGLMYFLLGQFESNNLYAEAKTPGETVSRIMKMRMALSYIHRNYSQDISLTDLSDLLELKPPSVVKLFRDIINKRPMEYVNSYRINCAMEMLKDDKNSVTSVAYECGFADVSYFSKVFKKYAGKTPRDYIKTLKYNILMP